jgi:hypothetical protein
MGTTRPHRHHGHPSCGEVPSLVVLLLVPVAQPQAGGPRLQVVVHQGQLYGSCGRRTWRRVSPDSPAGRHLH